MKFPKNPIDGELFETIPGIFYEYTAATKTWTKVGRPIIPLATPISDGLMSKEDFQKLNGMSLNPPVISLTAEDCTRKFNSGFIELLGSKTVKLTPSDQNIHTNTAYIDFGLDVEELIGILQASGKLRVVAQEGDQGDPGEDGDPGADALPVGPQGIDGQPGKNAEWLGALSEENVQIVDDSRAIVNITTEEISPTENYIVVKRANIGNPDACPDSIMPKDVQSPFMLALSSAPPKVVRSSINSKTVCSWACSSGLFYFNIDALVQSIRTQFIAYLATIKTEKEAVAKSRLETLVALFEDQKAALCCALEKCKSKQRNEDTRRYIESSRIAALASNRGVTIGNDTDHVVPDFFTSQKCEYDIVSLNDPEQIVE